MSTALGCGSATVSGFLLTKSLTSKTKSNSNYRFRVSCSSSSVSDPYKTLRIRRGASESEVRTAFRQLALKYHPDVCKGNNCGVKFHEINAAYDTVMNKIRLEEEQKKREKKKKKITKFPDESFRENFDLDWELWEEWMGWEGAGTRDYSSHINPYI